MYPNSPDTILPKLEVVRQALQKANIPVIVEAAAEYMVDHEMGNSVKNGDRLLTFGKNMILIEMSYIAPSPNFDEVVFGLRVKGVQPIVAHPERYNFYHNDFSKYEHMVDMGCLLQVNLLSLLGYYGKPVKMVAEKLLAKKMVSLLGTDMHHENHLFALKELALKKEFYKLIEGVDFKNSELF
jgi:tyrosine-protein phosphatase YwqE